MYLPRVNTCIDFLSKNRIYLHLKQLNNRSLVSMFGTHNVCSKKIFALIEHSFFFFLTKPTEHSYTSGYLVSKGSIHH